MQSNSQMQPSQPITQPTQPTQQSSWLSNMSIYTNTVSSIFKGYGLYIVIAIVIIILVVYLYRNLYMFEGMESGSGSTGSKGEVEIMRFSANAWCGACQESEADWNEVMKKYNGKVIKGYKLHFVEIDCSNAEKTPGSKENELMEKYAIEAFPTYKIIKGNNVIDYNMRFNDETFSMFIDKML